MTTQGAITIYNHRAGSDRRDVYIPTLVSEASYAESVSTDKPSKSIEDKPTRKLRIPISARFTDGRYYTPELLYRKLTDDTAPKCWTISHGDLITRGEPVVSAQSTEREIRAAAEAAGVEVITVTEYADNTLRGSDDVRHWRIEGR